MNINALHFVTKLFCRRLHVFRPTSCTMGAGSFSGVKSGRGVTLTPHPTSSAVGHERVELYLYSPYGPYGLYRASVPLKGYTLPLPLHVFRRNKLPPSDV